MAKVNVNLEEGSHAVVEYGGRIKVEFNKGGGFVVYENGIKTYPASNEGTKSSKTEAQIGDKMSDGTIYAGVSPDTGKPMYALPADAPMAMTWREAMVYTAALYANGHGDWRLPSQAELHVLYQNCNKGALKGTFNESSALNDSRHWSSAERPERLDYAWMQKFKNGNSTWLWKGISAYVRPLRSEP